MLKMYCLHAFFVVFYLLVLGQKWPNKYVQTNKQTYRTEMHIIPILSGWLMYWTLHNQLYRAKFGKYTRKSAIVTQVYTYMRQ